MKVDVFNARMVELIDTADLSSAAHLERVGLSPTSGTISVYNFLSGLMVNNKNLSVKIDLYLHRTEFYFHSF